MVVVIVVRKVRQFERLTSQEAANLRKKGSTKYLLEKYPLPPILSVKLGWNRNGVIIKGSKFFE